MNAPTPKPIKSPSYPSMPLPGAIAGAGEIEGKYRSAIVDRTDAARLLGYSSLSGPASMALSALASYGLIEAAGKGMVRVTERARALLHAHSPEERKRMILDAATQPPLFRDLMERFSGVAIPPEQGVITYLHREGFNPNAVRGAASSFLKTMTFLQEEGVSGSSGDAATVEVESHLPGAQRVALDAKEIRPIMNDAVVEGPVAGAVGAPPLAVAREQGEVEWSRIKVGTATNVRLLVSGEMGPKEIGKLITLLQAQKAVLEDD